MFEFLLDNPIRTQKNIENRGFNNREMTGKKVKAKVLKKTETN